MESSKWQRENMKVCSRHAIIIRYQLNSISHRLDSQKCKTKIISSMIGIKWSDISSFHLYGTVHTNFYHEQSKVWIPSNNYIVNLRTQTRGLRSIAWSV